LHVEYPGKLQEMESIGNKKFWDYVQEDKIFRLIPHNFIYTSYDILDVNDYMIDSFQEKNPHIIFFTLIKTQLIIGLIILYTMKLIKN
jgi:hypothetical protein